MAKRQKKIKIVMCGSCYNDFEETEVKLASLYINPETSKNGMYQKYLCKSCLEDPYFKKRVIETK